MSNAVFTMDFNISTIIGYAVLAIGVAFGYGKLKERVSNIKDDVEEIKQDIKKLLSKK